MIRVQYWTIFDVAVKATYGEVNLGKNAKQLSETGWAPDIIECREIFKDPITDDGIKKSAKGLLKVARVDGELVLFDQVTKEEEEEGELKTVFLNGKLTSFQTLSEIRERLSVQIPQFTH